MSSRNTFATLIAFVFFAAISGCESAIPPDIRTNLLVQASTAEELGYRIQWPVSIGLMEKDYVVSAALLGDVLVLFDTANVLTVIDTGTGRIRWRDKVGSKLERFSAPRRTEDRLIICSESRAHVYDVDLGNLVNVVDLHFVSNTTPLLYGDLMLHGSPSGIAWAQDFNTGLEIWSFDIGGSASVDPIFAGPTAIYATENGWVYCFDPATGVPNWRTHAWGEISAQPTATEDAVFISSKDRSVHAFAVASGLPERKGRQIWRAYMDAQLIRGPSMFGDNLYQYVPEEGLVAIGTRNGEKLWSLPWDDARPFMLQQGQLYLQRPGQIVRVTPDTGLVVKTVDIPAVHQVIPETPNGGNLYLIRLSGHILKLVPR